MRFLAAKFFIFSFLALNAVVANAGIYKYTFATSNYVDQNDPTVPGTLSGFIVIDTDLVNGDPLYQTGATGDQNIPNWITQASLTFTPNPGSTVAAETRTLVSAQPIDELRWLPTNGFDPTKEFTSQMTRFSLDNGNNFSTSGSMIQQFGFQGSSQFEEGEFMLSSPVNSVAVPGPLPILGLLPFAYYFQKLKKKLK